MRAAVDSGVRSDPLTEVVDEFGDILGEKGVHAALRFLNARTSHRFTGIYRFDPPTLRNVRLYDKENPRLDVGADAPMRETYCSIVGETRGPFATGDTRSDPRLVTHPARESVIAYCGVPLGSQGTLCHFDLTPRPTCEDEIDVLQAAAPLIESRLMKDGAFAP
ncbi:MAG: hypothetical protein ACRENI_10080 [Gemmatimonadaceae bacterium]